MGLRPTRNVSTINLDSISINTSERGGVLCYLPASGVDVVDYCENPSGVFPIGIKMNDTEYLDLSRQIHPRSLGRQVEQPYGIVGILVDGDFETDWVFITNPNEVRAGVDAYLGPSGTITDTNSFGGQKIGYFRGTLESNPHNVIFNGMGFSRSKIDSITKQVVVENGIRTLISTQGWIKVHIDQRIIALNRG